MAGIVTAARSVVAVAAGAVWRRLTRHQPDPAADAVDAAADGCPTPGASAPPSPPPTPPPGRLAPARPTKEANENKATGEPDGATVTTTHDTVAQAPPPPPGPPPPLSNALGANLCFFNALMQGLASAPPFVAWVQALGAAGGGGVAAATLVTHLATATGGAPRSAAALLPPGLKRGQQQDAAEAADLFVAALETAARDERAGGAACAPSPGLAAALPAPTPAPAPAQRLPRCPLSGTIVTQTVCAVCASPAAAHVAAFTCLPLVLPPGQGVRSLQGLLTAFAGIEAVPGVECGRCSLAASLAAAAAPPPALAALAAARAPLPVDPASLAAASSLPYRPARRTALRRCLVARPPPVLLLHVGRVRCGADGAIVKLRGGVGGLGTLDVGTMTATAAPPLLAGRDAPGARPLFYDVVAAVAHVGASPGGGHYVAYRRRGAAGEWWGVSDAKAWRAAEGEVEAADVALCVCVRRR